MKPYKILLFAILLFCCSNVNAQDNFKKPDTWLADNASAMGGRDIMTFYLNNKGRDERYIELKKLVDAAMN